MHGRQLHLELDKALSHETSEHPGYRGGEGEMTTFHLRTVAVTANILWPLVCTSGLQDSMASPSSSSRGPVYVCSTCVERETTVIVSRCLVHDEGDPLSHLGAGGFYGRGNVLDTHVHKT